MSGMQCCPISARPTARNYNFPRTVSRTNFLSSLNSSENARCCNGKPQYDRRHVLPELRVVRGTEAHTSDTGLRAGIPSMASSAQPSSSSEKSDSEIGVHVKFSIHRDMEFGQNLVLVGNHPILGEWNVNEGVPLDWVEGNRWEVEMVLPQFELIEYKYVVRCGWHDSATTIWAGGPNCLLATNQSRRMVLEDTWVSQEQWWCSEDDPAAVAASQAARVYMDCHPKPRHPRKPIPVFVPDWARSAVFYAIYPLGAFGAPFVNDTTSDPVPRLAKIREQYEHLERLGVTAIYFSPLFESETHGYDTVDYFKIDRRLGDIELFREIVSELHERGIHVILDGVFNHTGRQHEAFRDLAENGPGLSDYADWYTLGARPDEYEGWCIVDYEEENSGFWAGSGFAYDCWEGHPQLPRLNHANRAVREYIFEIARFWLEDVGIDGWRLDVAHEISPDFWREFRTVCERVKPDCILVGEMIHGNYRGWVGPDRLHSGTNYQLSRAIWSSLVESNYDELYTALQRERKLYEGMMLLNFVSNHDVIRLASVLTEPEHYTLAIAALLFLHGIPCLYYGDEYGVEGVPGEGVDENSGGDDSLRGPMLDADDASTWPEAGKERLETTRRLVRIRNANPAFVHGSVDVENIEYRNQQFIFARSSEQQVGVVAFNSSAKAADPWPEVCVPVSDGTVFTDVWSDDGAKFSAYAGKVYVGPMAPNSIRVLVASRGGSHGLPG
uniref:Neopullulanase n=1 Tax=Tetraselmis sp. GSL018 TaxID=582737 RepID=A0A061SEP4_9CHLO